MIQHPAEHLTSNYSNDDESNIYKLLSIGHLEHEEIFRSLEAIEKSRDINKNHIGAGINDISFMQIPTAELRRENKVEYK